MQEDRKECEGFWEEGCELGAWEWGGEGEGKQEGAKREEAKECPQDSATSSMLRTMGAALSHPATSSSMATAGAWAGVQRLLGYRQMGSTLWGR